MKKKKKKKNQVGNELPTIHNTRPTQSVPGTPNLTPSTKALRYSLISPVNWTIIRKRKTIDIRHVGIVKNRLARFDDEN